MRNFEKSRQALDFLILGGAIGIISILALTFLPKNFSISPLVIFGIIFLSNITTLLVPDVSERSTGAFSRFFLARLALSVVFAVLLIFISNFAQRL
jgi:hypothetical protein